MRYINKADLLERVIFKVTSGRFIFTIIVAGVYAYLACNGLIEKNFIREITLIVLYAYFSRPRMNGLNGNGHNGNGENNGK